MPSRAGLVFVVIAAEEASVAGNGSQDQDFQVSESRFYCFSAFLCSLCFLLFNFPSQRVLLKPEMDLSFVAEVLMIGRSPVLNGRSSFVQSPYSVSNDAE